MRKVTSEQKPRSSGGGPQEPIREKPVPCRRNCASHVPREPCALRAQEFLSTGFGGWGGVGRTGGKGRGRGGQGGSSMPGDIYAAVVCRWWEAMGGQVHFPGPPGPLCVWGGSKEPRGEPPPSFPSGASQWLGFRQGVAMLLFSFMVFKKKIFF